VPSSTRCLAFFQNSRGAKAGNNTNFYGAGPDDCAAYRAGPAYSEVSAGAWESVEEPPNFWRCTQSARQLRRQCAGCAAFHGGPTHGRIEVLSDQVW
jgi:hypothetical protein